MTSEKRQGQVKREMDIRQEKYTSVEKHGNMTDGFGVWRVEIQSDMSSTYELTNGMENTTMLSSKGL
jgi:hypothetical protein